MKLLSCGVFVSVANIARSKFKRRLSKFIVGCKGVIGRGGGGVATILGGLSFPVLWMGRIESFI